MDNTAKDRKDRAVQGILDAAIEIFAEGGFAGARVDEIARRAGVNKAMIYYRVGDKATLYSEVLHQVFFGIAERLTLNLKKGQTPEEKMKAYIRTFIGTFKEQPHLAPIMMREMATGGHNLPDIVLMDLGRILNILKGILEEGAQEGVFIDVNPPIVHLMVISPLFMRKQMELIASRRKGHAQILRQLDKGEPVDVGLEIEKLMMRALKRIV